MDQTRKDILVLCSLSLLTIFITAFITISVFNTYVDSWGYTVYYEENVIPFLLSGDLPYINHFWEYPVLMMVPVILSAIPSVLLNDKGMFFSVFSTLMILCNFVTIICIYFTTLHIFKSRDRAYIAGFMYAVSVSVAYITLTNYDPLPTCLMMAGLTLTITGEGKWKVGGYVAGILGFFAKIFPIILIPFLILFNAKDTSIKEEVASAIKAGVIPVLVLFLPIFLLNQDSIKTYFITNAAGKPAFVASFVYTVFTWINGVMGIDTSITAVSIAMTLILVTVLSALLYYAYTAKKKDPALLLCMILIALVAIVACSKYHSPQYMMWFTPILCILVSGEFVQVITYYVLQIIWYLKFPILFYRLYVNDAYLYPLPTIQGYETLFFFTLEYVVLFYLVWSVTKSKVTFISGGNYGS
jgi:4-amino-4-deoxy-L-arabinose transferase-like glycosyltransferase